MTKISVSRSLLCATTLSLLIFFVSSCKKKGPTPPPRGNINFNVSLSGTQQTPPNASSATGNGYASYNYSTGLFEVYMTNYNGLIPTSGNIHQGAAGITGPIVMPFRGLNGQVAGTYLATFQADILIANLYYININSSAYPSGEIRGQLIKQ